MAEAMDADPDGAATTLCEKAENGEADIPSKLVTVGNCGTKRILDGMTPLMCAARANENPIERHRDCAEHLLLAAGDAKAQLANAVDLSGQSCLHHAAASDNVRVMEEALRVGAKVNAQDKLGRTALLIAVEQNKVEAASLLLRAGADQELANKDGRSPVKLADEQNLRMKWLLKSYQPREIPSDFTEVSPEKRKLIPDITRGAFCDLYETDTKPPNLPILVRVLKEQSNTDVRDNELRGLEAIKKAKHRNIAQHIKSNVKEGIIEIFLEKVEGKTLRQVLDINGPFPEVQIQKFFKQIASALCYLHSHPSGPIVHRDIRCENIMIGQVGVLKLIDFGFALPKGSICVHPAVLCGVLRNQAPEVVHESKFGRASDIWAAGCVLYAMAMGCDPFKSDQLIKLGKEIDGEVPKIQPPNSDKFSPELSFLYEKCMQKDPTVRISAAAMVLHPFLKWGGQQNNEFLLVEKISELQNKIRELIESLEGLKKRINESNRKENAAKVGTSAIGVAGGITAIVGWALLIPSLGAALPLAIAGTSVAVASGAGAAAAAVAGRMMQSEDLKNAQSKFDEFRKLFELLLVDQVQHFCKELHNQVVIQGLAIDLRDTKSLIRYLKIELETIIKDLEKWSILMSKEQEECIKDKFLNGLKDTVDAFLTELDDITAAKSKAPRSINRDMSNQCHRLLLRAIDFLVRVLRILLFGSDDNQWEFYCDEFKGVLRTAAGSTQLSMELASIAGRTVAGRVIGIVGSGVFTVADIAFLVLYSRELHKARTGGSAKKANPILCHIKILNKLLAELEGVETN